MNLSDSLSLLSFTAGAICFPPFPLGRQLLTIKPWIKSKDKSYFSMIQNTDHINNTQNISQSWCYQGNMWANNFNKTKRHQESSEVWHERQRNLNVFLLHIFTISRTTKSYFPAAGVSLKQYRKDKAMIWPNNLAAMLLYSNGPHFSIHGVGTAMALKARQK